MRKITAVTFCILISATQAQAIVLCLGVKPNFLMQIEGGLASFDYLGDGEFEILPPPDEADILRSPRSFVLLTGQTRIPVRTEPRSCTALETTLPLSIEINIQTSQGDTRFRGCCLVRE